MANAAADTGKRDEAIRLHREALSIYEAAGAAEDVVLSMHSLAFLYEDAGAYDKAVRHAARAMERAKGTDGYYGACFYLAGLYENEEKYDKAKTLYAKVLDWVEQTGGRGHSAYTTVATKLACASAALGEYDSALIQMTSIRNIIAERIGEDYLCYAGCLRNMAMLYRQLGEPGEARELMLKSMKIKKRLMGDYTRDIMTDALFMIDLYLEREMDDNAVDMFVYMLMRADSAELSGRADELARIIFKTGPKRYDALLRALEDINDRKKLQPVMEDWIKWETAPD
jgi:tetratricopeptide (TPR) repeat protein